MYNKSSSLLRIETTINNTRDFKVFRRPNDDEGKPASWQKMRKGVSDLHRRCEVSQQCKDRYGDALAAAQVEEKLKKVPCQGIRKSRQGSAKEVCRSYDPTDKDAAGTRPNPQSSAGQPLCFDGERPEVLLFADDSFSPWY